jgi:hypothetical protein
VSGALEGALLGIPSIAVSSPRVKDHCDFTQGGVAAGQVAEAVLLRGMPRFTFLNVNVPLVPSKGFKATVQAKRNHVTVVSERMDPRHKAVLLDRRGREPLGVPGPLGLPGGVGRLRLDHAAAARHDRATSAFEYLEGAPVSRS